jgi:hypothetical protein
MTLDDICIPLCKKSLLQKYSIRVNHPCFVNLSLSVCWEIIIRASGTITKSNNNLVFTNNAHNIVQVFSKLFTNISPDPVVFTEVHKYRFTSLYFHSCSYITAQVVVFLEMFINAGSHP